VVRGLPLGDPVEASKYVAGQPASLCGAASAEVQQQMEAAGGNLPLKFKLLFDFFCLPGAPPLGE
jgi:hypothetical protein